MKLESVMRTCSKLLKETNGEMIKITSLPVRSTDIQTGKIAKGFFSIHIAYRVILLTSQIRTSIEIETNEILKLSVKSESNKINLPPSI